MEDNSQSNSLSTIEKKLQSFKKYMETQNIPLIFQYLIIVLMVAGIQSLFIINSTSSFVPEYIYWLKDKWKRNDKIT